ncbi:hypothetical protein ACGF1Z_03005 [Streptomyces sp. NPDC048018]|uniref:hypothetical protein n=1 Tax=Streptomyces sp. NPDC048018 TaxID=3365499 RepID=UPI00371144F5
MAHIAPLLPQTSRTTGLAVVQTAQTLARALGALAFGALAAHGGPGTAFAVFGCTTAAAVAAARLIHRPGKEA